MKSATQCLQPSDIEALLAGTEPASQSELWEEHFSSCESCRMAMAGQVGDQEWWVFSDEAVWGSFSKPSMLHSIALSRSRCCCRTWQLREQLANGLLAKVKRLRLSSTIT